VATYKFDNQFFQPALLNGSIGVNANLDFELGGVNAADVNSTLGTNGGNVLATAGASGDQVIVSPHQDTNQSSLNSIVWSTVRRPIQFRCAFRAAASLSGVPVGAIDDTTSCFGLRPTITGAAAFDTGTDDDKVIIRAQQVGPISPYNPTNYEIVVSNKGDTTIIDTGVRYSPGSRYEWLITVTDILAGPPGILGSNAIVTVRGGLVSATAPNTLNRGVLNYPGLNNRNVTVQVPLALDGTNLGKPFWGVQANVAAVKTQTLLRMAGSCEFIS
jgi:hypothetical protein